MIQTIFKQLIVLGLMLSICNITYAQGNRKDAKTAVLEAVPFAIANNYFVRNDFNRVLNPAETDYYQQIGSQEEFSEILMAARTMGDKGLPTSIDFSKQYALVVVGELTDFPTSIKPVNFQKDGEDKAEFTYQIVKGEEKQTYTTRPCLILVVDRASTKGAVTFKKID